jgi:protoheme IX farnesyltransferase
VQSSELAIPSRASTKVSASDLVALTKPRVKAMVLLTTAGGLWLGARYGGADVHVTRWTWLFALLGTALVVGGANALNMVWERDTDGLMARTARRPLPAGRLSPKVALGFGLTLSIASVPVLLFGVNATTAMLAVLANLLYVLAYTPLKRRTHWAVQVGAVPGAIPPLLGWTAATGRVDLAGVALFSILFTWQIAHFHAIALFRKADYARAGLVVMPNVEGDEATRHAIVRWAGAAVVASVALVPLRLAHQPYLVAAVILGIAWVGVCALGLRRNAGTTSARAAFFASLLHLTALFGALAIDAAVR